MQLLEAQLDNAVQSVDKTSILRYTISDKEIKTSADTIARQIDMGSAFSFPKEKGRMLLANAEDT